MRTILSALILLGLFAPPERITAAEPIDYVKQVKPILSARCYACHGALQQKAGLRVDTVKSLIAERDSGAAVVPGKSDESLIIDLIAETGEGRMPPPSGGEALSAVQVDVIRRWIDQGAFAPDDDRPEPDPREHWAFRSPVASAIPGIDSPGEGPLNPIDAFLAVSWKAKGLKPQPQASKELLQRRVYLDLIGLPPTAEERAAFLGDESPDAYERMVDRLLEGRPHAERWARHWMDIWRYSDWWGLGAQLRNSQKHIWHWRDWIIESITADVGYDRMVRDMLAADELAPDDPSRLRATGYLARGYYLFNRNTWLEDVVEHTGKAFLGLTLNCAKCHDHKYDPISQKDYYRFRAFFEPYEVRLDQVPGVLNFEKDGIPRVYDAHLDAPTYRFERGNEAKPIKDQPLKPGIPPLLSLGELKIEPVRLPVEAWMPGLRAFVLTDRLRAVEAKINGASADLSSKRNQLSKATAEKTGDLTRLRMQVELAQKTLDVVIAESASITARAAADRARVNGTSPSDAKRIAIQAAKAERLLALSKAEEAVVRVELPAEGKTKVKGAGKGKTLEQRRKDAADALAAARKALDVETDQYTPIAGALKSAESPLDKNPETVFVYPSTSTGRRTALANWLTDRRNSLTARVAVNHIWMRHFGTPLVATVFDLGRKGTPPTHPELLDWLAVDFMEHGWSMKRLHRMIVLSEAYRRSSSSAGADPKTLASDPENRHYWRMNPRRMEAQAVRDSLLHLAGMLKEKTGGPSVAPTEELVPWRSLYFTHSHNDHVKFLATFDDAGVLDCYRRDESIVPAQALALWNSKLSMMMGTKIAGRLEAKLGQASDSAYAVEAFRTILASSPNPDELRACEKTLADLKILLKTRGAGDPERKAREILVQSLINHNDFVTIR
jgi:hypothetical protein